MVLFVVLRIWEKFYVGVMVKMSLVIGIKVKIVVWVCCVGMVWMDYINVGMILGMWLLI